MFSVKSEVTKQKEQRESRGNETNEDKTRGEGKKPLCFFGFVSHQVEVFEVGAKNKTLLTLCFSFSPFNVNFIHFFPLLCKILVYIH